ncbi:hypothetical protein ACJIZ3_023809 [Penstemon smallii]|uniref:DNA N(6)-methyladenine demethylase n=1 Tax=Penstemon smallii TaxID=265156 RepID=A0ABD3TSH9_9LAMI
MPKSVYQYKPKSASPGVGNISPNVGNSRLVQNVPKAEDQTPKQVDLHSVMVPDLGDDFPSLSTCSKSSAKSIRSIQSTCGDEENSSSSTISCRVLDDVTPIKKEPSLIGSSGFQDGRFSQEVDIGSEGSRGNGEFDKSDGQQKEHSYDICLKRTANVVKLKSPLFAMNREKRNEMKRLTEGENIKILRPGMVLLKGYLPLTDQVKLIRSCRDLGQGSGGFYQPSYRDGAKLHLRMMCLGKNWDPETSEYGDERPIDGAKPPPIPAEFQQLVRGAIQSSHNYLDSNSKMKIAKTILPPMSPNICIVNFYAKTGKLGLHQDKDESPESLRKGLPVVSFSIGDSAEFLYGDERDIEKAEKVLLESGDVLIFGGKSRHIFHGVSSIIPDTTPKALEEETNLRPGRLNLTFREY